MRSSIGMRNYTEEELNLLFDQLLEEKESEEVEFKTSAGGFPGSFWDTYSSFANTHGGVIILGVKEKNGVFALDGISADQAEKYKKNYFDSIHNKTCVNVALTNESDVQDVLFHNTHILFFYIPQASRELKPVYRGLDPLTGTFRRDGEGDYRCSPEEVRSMFADANLVVSPDARILKHFTFDDLDKDSVRQYRQKFNLANPDHAWSMLGDVDFLKKLNVYRRDRETGEEGITLAGLLMLGTYSSIVEGCPNFFVDYREVTEEADRWVNRIAPDGNWESNLFQFYYRVMPILREFLPLPFRTENAQRQSDTPARIAVREAFANALVHTDYSVNASINVYKYSNRIVFSNPGTMLISIMQYYRGGDSVCRNKYLQNMFMFLGSAEKAGSGADKIMHGWDDVKWKRPLITERSRPNKVELVMSMESLLNDMVEKELRARYGRTALDTLSSTERTVIALAFSEEVINNGRLQGVTGMHRADITATLCALVEKGFLLSEGYGKGKTYRLFNVATSGFNVATSGFNVATSGFNVATSGFNVATSGSNVATLEGNHRIAGRLSKQQVQELLEEICDDWRTVDYIANRLNRTVKYVRNSIIPNNLDVLERYYGDTPNHPAQKYRRKRGGEYKC